MPKRTYLRDSRVDFAVDPKVSEQMSRIRAKNTKPELALRKALAQAGIKGYRLHYGKLPGKPDVVFVGRRVAVFMHGCFWHCCPHCQPPRPKVHKDFWDQKLDRNVQRDKRNVRALRKEGWRVITEWECRFKRNDQAVVRRIRRALGQGPLPR